ncbi:MAG: response regulator transcription factor [Limnohabitans sp.]|jgi:RNA polymerase sigma factor (sigma-70 family)|nr:response regulator transcription factor [Limnohabitans sp.]
MNENRLICIVDDDPQVRDSLSLMLGLKGYNCRPFDSGESFMSSMPDEPCCIVLDLKMAGMDGLALQQTLLDGDRPYAVIFLTAFADTEVMRSAFLSRAIDFLEKPVVMPRLLEALDKAFAQLNQSRQRVDLSQRMDRLTPRERDVYHLIVEGMSHREVGERLGISPRTVEVHKARIMEKLQLTSLAELMRFALKAA